jgi:phospholipid/cholesterol/gamma-HCH transport system substrate-binding protein
MENRSHALAAGLFALVLGAALAFSIWWFTDSREITRDYLLISESSITGLNPEAQVRFRGIAAGKVSDIRIDPANPKHILVRISVAESFPVTKGTRASLGYQGVTGLAYVQLDDRGSDPTPLIADGSGLPQLALDPGLMDQLSDTTLDAIQHFRKLADQVGRFFNEENITRITATLQRVESAAAGIDRTFSDAPAAIAAIRAALSDQNLRQLSTTLGNLEQASAEVTPAMSELRTLMTRLNEMSDRLDRTATVAGEGLLDSTLPQLNSLLKELTLTSLRLGKLIEEVDASPQMLLIGRSRRPPGPGEAGFESERN